MGFGPSSSRMGARLRPRSHGARVRAHLAGFGGLCAACTYNEHTPSINILSLYIYTHTHTLYIYLETGLILCCSYADPPFLTGGPYACPPCEQPQTAGPHVCPTVRATAAIFIGRHDPLSHLPHSPATAARVGILRRSHHEGSTAARVTRDPCYQGCATSSVARGPHPPQARSRSCGCVPCPCPSAAP
jgi:hypothetical protein